jgi:3-oxoacyl-[acyl-carrier protein] reductase
MPESSTAPAMLAGKTGFVTGAGHGIGRAIAVHLADLGADVGINYRRSESAAKDVVEEVKQRGRRALLLPGDVGVEASVKEIVKTATAEFGRIDFVVNNAGGGDRDDPIDVARFEDWNQVISQNLTSSFLCTRHVAPQMLRQRCGRIVNISSICALTGDCGPAYCAAKAGLMGLTRHSAVWLAPHVQVNAVLPGFVSSQSHNESKVAKITPGRRIGRPEDVADLVGYLVSSGRSFLTGACITLDGSVMNGIIARSMDWDDIHAREQALMK